MTSADAQDTSKSNMTDQDRRQAIDELLRRIRDGNMPHGAQKEVSVLVGRSKSTISKLWTRYCASLKKGNLQGEWASRIKKNSGRKRIDRAEARVKVKAVPINKRSNIRLLASTAGISKHMVSSLLSEGILTRRTGRIKPSLTDKHRLDRLEHILASIDDTSLHFECMHDVVHIDEKWFNEDKVSRRYLLLEDETAPLRSRKSKNFIPKTMFLARPRHLYKFIFLIKSFLLNLIRNEYVYSSQRSRRILMCWISDSSPPSNPSSIKKIFKEFMAFSLPFKMRTITCRG